MTCPATRSIRSHQPKNFQECETVHCCYLRFAPNLIVSYGGNFVEGWIMSRGAVHAWALLGLLACTPPGISQAAGIGWPEAVSRLAEERSKAEICVALLKGHGDKEQISHGRLAYGTAKADFDAVIAGLVTALAEGGNPESLPSLNGKLERGASGLGEFCRAVADLVPSTPGRKDILVEMVKAAIEPIVKALSEGVGALYTDHRKDDALTRQTIQTQLEAAKWPDFGEVAAAQ
jgi:hypothetical protein